VLLAPVGVLELVHSDADTAVARAAAEIGLPLVISTQASQPLETIAPALGEAPRWFQLYWSRDRHLVASFVRRAEAAGCEAIVVTLDTHLLGWRPFDLDQGFLPFAQGQGIAQYTSDPVFSSLALRRASAGSTPSRGGPGPAPSAPC
jgi:isopentenyl diphosphate isomerase/L-lactate dehydrogenase-like FMN-dependent dehydrogenase